MKNFALTIITVFLYTVHVNAQDNRSITVKIENPKGSGKFYEKDVVEFIEEGRKEMNTLYENNFNQKKIIMVMGLTGTGKSTLINYLNGIPLVCIKVKDKWIIDLESENVTLPGGFRIGHGTKSETLYPSVYSPPDKDFTYVDNPGFVDTRGFGVEIANGFFREQITKSVTELKFLLLITHPDLKLRGQQFRDSIRGFSNFLGVFDDDDTKMVSKSIGIIVTRVENDGDTDEEMKEILKEKLIEILKEEKDSNRITNNEDLIFNMILSDSQLEIFSNPKVKGPVNDFQSKQIFTLIEKLKFINKDEAKVHIRIAENYLPQLRAYMDDQFLKFEQKIETELTEFVNEYYRKTLRNSDDPVSTAVAYKTLNEFILKASHKTSFEAFIDSINDEIVNQTEKKNFLLKKTVLNYFIQIIPVKHKQVYISDKQWISVNLITRLKNLINELINNFDKQYKTFEQTVDNALTKFLTDYFAKSMHNLNEVKKATLIYSNLNDFIIKSTKTSTFMSFMSSLNNEIVSQNQKEDLLSKRTKLQTFIDILPDNLKQTYSSEKQWISVNLISKIKNQMDQLIIYFDTQYKALQPHVENILDKGVSDYFPLKIDQANDVNDISSLKNVLNSLVQKPNLNIVSFAADINEQILNRANKDDFSRRNEALNEFIQKLPQEKQINFPRERKWIGVNLILKLNNMIAECNKYYSESDSFNNGIFTYKGYFTKMSSVLAKIWSTDYIRNLNRVKIFTTHKFIFDVNYAIGADKYMTNSPDLIIFSPNVLVNGHISVDLSCINKIPGYPDNIAKASFGGVNGKSGLPGYSGGSVLISADYINDRSNLNIVSKGCQGGPGQIGKN